MTRCEKLALTSCKFDPDQSECKSLRVHASSGQTETPVAEIQIDTGTIHVRYLVHFHDTINFSDIFSKYVFYPHFSDYG